MCACDWNASCDLARSLPLRLRRSLFRFFLAAKQSFTSAAEDLAQPRRLTLNSEHGANTYRGGQRHERATTEEVTIQSRQKENGRGRMQQRPNVWPPQKLQTCTGRARQCRRARRSCGPIDFPRSSSDSIAAGVSV
jgi:hypothetical protein